MGKFVVKQTKNGFVFNLKAGNGEIIATSQTYSGEDACMNGIESVRKNAELAKLEDQTVENFIWIRGANTASVLRRVMARLSQPARDTRQRPPVSMESTASAAMLRSPRWSRKNPQRSNSTAQKLTGFLRYAENPFELRLLLFINSAISLDCSPIERHPLHREL